MNEVSCCTMCEWYNIILNRPVCVIQLQNTTKRGTDAIIPEEHVVSLEEGVKYRYVRKSANMYHQFTTQLHYVTPKD